MMASDLEMSNVMMQIKFLMMVAQVAVKLNQDGHVVLVVELVLTMVVAVVPVD